MTDRLIYSCGTCGSVVVIEDTDAIATEGLINNVHGVGHHSGNHEYYPLPAGATVSGSAQVVEEEPVAGGNPSFVYSEDCATNVDNATVNAPYDYSFPSGEPLAEDDTVAAVSPRGDCVGHIPVSSGGIFTLAVAAKLDSTLGLPEQPGMYEGEDFSFEIYDRSEDVAYSMWPVFESCEQVDIEICDEGGYNDDVFFSVDTLSVEKPDYPDDTVDTGSLTIGVTTTYPYSDGDPALQNCNLEDPSNLVEVDAARARKYAYGETEWVRRDTSTATGNGYALATPESPEGQPFPQTTGAALFDVPVDFCATGPHYLWLRVAHSGGAGADNSFHVRDPTDTWHSYNDIYSDAHGDVAEAQTGEWVWVNTGGSNFGVTEQGPMTIEVAETGPGLLLFRMREGGIRIDEIRLTTSGSYVPE